MHAHQPSLPLAGRSIATVPARVRTPVSSRTSGRAFVRRAGTPTSSSFPRSSIILPTSASASASLGRPLLRRSSSQNTPMLMLSPVPFSAKKWAKTAHLHELRGPNRQARGEPEHTPTHGSADEKVTAERRDAEGPEAAARAEPAPEGDMFWQAEPAPARRRKNVSAVPSERKRREPLSALQNAASGAHIATLCQPIGLASPDADTESEGWVDTDVEGSDAGAEFGEF